MGFCCCFGTKATITLSPLPHISVIHPYGYENRVNTILINTMDSDQSSCSTKPQDQPDFTLCNQENKRSYL